jgi:hypothetical protein
VAAGAEPLGLRDLEVDTAAAVVDPLHILVLVVA